MTRNEGRKPDPPVEETPPIVEPVPDPTPTEIVRYLWTYRLEGGAIGTGWPHESEGEARDDDPRSKRFAGKVEAAALHRVIFPPLP